MGNVLKSLEIVKMLTLSTTHIKESTSEFLDDPGNGLITYPKAEHGWFIHVDSAFYEGNADHIPADLKDVLELARDNECTWLCLDCDGEIINQLPYYDW